MDATLLWMGSLYVPDRTAALALTSTTVDMRVTPIANEAWGVHAVLADDVLRARGPR